MNELDVNYGVSQSKKLLNIIIGVYLAGFTLYFSIIEGVANRFDILFFCAMIGFVLAVMLILFNTLWLPDSLLKIDSNTIIINLPKQNKVIVDWANVSQVNIGVSYVVFLINGAQKQRKLDLSSFVYEDVRQVKSKVIELCEYKNIPYHND